MPAATRRCARSVSKLSFDNATPVTNRNAVRRIAGGVHKTKGRTGRHRAAPVAAGGGTEVVNPGR
jgi:hypothetical protein